MLIIGCSQVNLRGVTSCPGFRGQSSVICHMPVSLRGSQFFKALFRNRSHVNLITAFCGEAGSSLLSDFLDQEPETWPDEVVLLRSRLLGRQSGPCSLLIPPRLHTIWLWGWNSSSWVQAGRGGGGEAHPEGGLVLSCLSEERVFPSSAWLCCVSLVTVAPGCTEHQGFGFPLLVTCGRCPGLE